MQHVEKRGRKKIFAQTLCEKRALIQGTTEHAQCVSSFQVTLMDILQARAYTFSL
jgi:hypothetical protein